MYLCTNAQLSNVITSLHILTKCAMYMDGETEQIRTIPETTMGFLCGARTALAPRIITVLTV